MNTKTSFEELARLLNADQDTVRGALEKLQKITDTHGVPDDIWKGNLELIQDRLEKLGVKRRGADVISRALMEKLREDERMILEYLSSPTCDSEEGCKSLIDGAREVANVGKGYFLKRDKAAEFLIHEPPKAILSHFKFRSVDELLKHYELFEVYSALRFMEDREWLNKVFFKQLERVTPDDFEERDIEVHVLKKEWLLAAESFLQKKFHNVSHLKELGIIFIIPLSSYTTGSTLRLLTLVLHYLHEVRFYSDLFYGYAKEGEVNFARRLVSALRGDVLDRRFTSEEEGWKWMIVQRYLAKEDPNDWRLAEPHVNPEAIHWAKAETDIVKLGKLVEGVDLGFWKDLDHVGAFFPDASGAEVRVPFNLVDVVMDVVSNNARYLYHQHEALWNALFIGCVGEKQMEELIKKNFDAGYINVQTITPDPS